APGDALGTLMDRQIAADAVAGTVVEIETRFPQRPPCERVEVNAACTPRKARRGDGDMPLEDQAKALAHFARRVADGDRARDVGRSIEILGAGVHEIELSRAKLAVGGRGHAVMHDGAIGAGARDGVEADLLEGLGLAANLLEPA